MEKVYDKISNYIIFTLSSNNIQNISYEYNKQINIIGVGMEMTQTNFNSFTYLHCYSFEYSNISVTIGMIELNKFKMIVSISNGDPNDFSLNNKINKYVYYDVGKLFNEIHNKLDGLQDSSITIIDRLLNGMDGYDKWYRNNKINDIIN